LLVARKRLDVITAYRQVGKYRGAAGARVAREKDYESVGPSVARGMCETRGRISVVDAIDEPLCCPDPTHSSTAITLLWPGGASRSVINQRGPKAMSPSAAS
jgi:hypothetical protein